MGDAMIRGIVLIVAAIALGVVLLNATDERPLDVAADAPAADGSGAGEPAEPAEEPGLPAAEEPGEAEEPEEVPEPRDPSSYSVLVANGSGVAGAAGRNTEIVEGAGFQTATPTDADRRDSSIVYYNEGFELEAAAVAATFDPELPIEPMPEPPPVLNLSGADVLVVIGPDLAGG